MKDTALIEGLWEQLKGYIKRIYNTLPARSYMKDYLYEAMFRRNIKLKEL